MLDMYDESDLSSSTNSFAWISRLHCCFLGKTCSVGGLSRES